MSYRYKLPAPLDELPDGEYLTGYMRQEWMDSNGQHQFSPCEEVAVIKNHQLIGFRNPDGSLVVFPKQGAFEFPIIDFPPLLDDDNSTPTPPEAIKE